MTIFILTIFMALSLKAQSCRDLILQSVEANKHAIFLKNYILANLRFPRSDLAMHMNIVGTFMREGAEHAPLSFSESEVKHILRLANNAHETRKLDVDLGRTDIDRLTHASMKNSVALFFIITEFLADNVNQGEGPLIVYPDELQQGQRIEYYKNELIKYYNSQSKEGQKFLLAVGESIEAFLWTDEAKKVSENMQALTPRSQHMIVIEEMNLGDFFIQFIEKRHPELRFNAQGSPESIASGLVNILARNFPD